MDDDDEIVHFLCLVEYIKYLCEVIIDYKGSSKLNVFKIGPKRRQDGTTIIYANINVYTE